MIKKVIGCNQTHYTGWIIMTETVTRRRSTVELVHYVFCQQLTRDPEMAKKLWGTDEIDLSLKNMSSFTQERTPYSPGYLRLGKYAGEAYDRVPEQYLGWYYINAAQEDEIDDVAKLLIEKYNWKVIDGRAVCKEDYDMLDTTTLLSDERKAMVDGCTPIEVDCAKNLDGEGFYYDADTGLTLWFPEYKILQFKNFKYGAPLDNMGQAKKIKGRRIAVTSWEKMSDDMIEVIEWDTIKL